MLELLLLERYKQLDINSNFMVLDYKNFDENKFNDRLQELRDEFLRPYVMDDTLSRE